jgi:hypothetical protein
VRGTALGQDLRLFDPVLFADAVAEAKRLAHAPHLRLHPGRDLLIAAHA